MADFKDVLSVIKLNDEEYFSLTQEKIDLLDDQLVGLNRFDTLLLKAPAVIDINKFSSFPVLRILQSDSKRKWLAPELRNMLAVAYNRTTGELFAGPARRDTKTLDYSAHDHDDKLPDNLSTTAYSTGCKLFDLKFPLEIPWAQAHYAITLISFDWVSNRADVFLYDNEKNPDNNPVFQGLPAGVPVIDAAAEVKSAPVQRSVTFTVPAKIKNDPSELFLIQGKFRLPLAAGDFFRLKNSRTVVVPIYVMIVEKNMDQSSPVIAGWLVKADLPEEKGAAFAVEGTFEFKLPDLIPVVRKFPLTPKDYCCYIVAQGTCFGPQRVTIEK